MSAEQRGLVKLEEQPAAPSPSAPPGERKLRLKAVDRQQICWRAIDPERLVEEDHPVRALWDLLGGGGFEPFLLGHRGGRGAAGA